jgi:hypothetical protein
VATERYACDEEAGLEMKVEIERRVRGEFFYGGVYVSLRNRNLAYFTRPQPQL